MKRKIVVSVLCIMMSFGLIACQKEEEIPEYVTTIGAEISDELSSGQFYLDGEVYQFPITVGELKENGYDMAFSYENADTFTLSPGGQSDTFAMSKEVGDEYHRVWCKVINSTEEELKLDDCEIGYLEIDYPADMLFPGGIWTDTTCEDAIDAYGEPRDMENDSDTFYRLWYDIEMEDGSKWEVEFFMNSWSISSVTYTWEGIED